MGLKPKTWSKKTRRSVGVGAVVAAALAIAAASTPAFAGTHGNQTKAVKTATPIKHLVVIFQENVSFDHYFGTYPKAANTDGTTFKAKSGTPAVNGLTNKLLNNNPNEYNPSRLSPDEALTCDQNHSYGPEQQAYDGGKADQFVQFTETDKCTGMPIIFGEPGLVMDYYDGNTVTGLWNYAQNYAMSDNSFDAGFGPSSPGALNLISGQTHGVQAVDSVTGKPVSNSLSTSPDKKGIGTVIGDPDPAFDDCSDTNHTSTNPLAKMTGQNVGDLLNNEGVTWGWFQGGFAPTGKANGYAVCGATHTNVGGNAVVDYSAHHNPFEYYKSTSNPKHLPPSSVKNIGKTDQANHQYDMTDFDAAVAANNVPAVSFLKAPEYQDGHAGYSDPLDEQQFLVKTINELQKSKDWSSTAVVIAYDDSDGWYDHVAPPIHNGSSDPANDQAMCAPTKKTKPLNGYEDRCGDGPRQPLLVISPYSKTNYVDHSETTQPSILRFIEDNWKTGRIGDGSLDASAGKLTNMFNFNQKPVTKPLILDPKTGAVKK
ncbi:alkaline phosphatase family protein [Rugosimonospora acidiphila]|uniref:Alkaline phosphatase family protein n=1 Tax=Rugosimonospora acidiphila TaxID=556531 RepID=A0ABP9RSA0_9ACTN